MVSSSVFFFRGGGGPVSFRAVKGGQSALELGVKLFAVVAVAVVVVVCFCFGRAWGQSASWL